MRILKLEEFELLEGDMLEHKFMYFNFYKNLSEYENKLINDIT